MRHISEILSDMHNLFHLRNQMEYTFFFLDLPESELNPKIQEKIGDGEQYEKILSICAETRKKIALFRQDAALRFPDHPSISVALFESHEYRKNQDFYSPMLDVFQRIAYDMALSFYHMREKERLSNQEKKQEPTFTQLWNDTKNSMGTIEDGVFIESKRSIAKRMSRDYFRQFRRK